MKNALSVLECKIGANSFQNGSITTYINPYSYLFFRKNISLFNKFDRIGVDGVSLVILLSLVGIKVAKRESFDMTSQALVVFNECIELEKDIFFVGSTEKSINNFINIIKNNFPKLNISGYRNGYFDNDEDKEQCLKKINILNPEVIIVGMGTPFQEQFLIDLKNTGWNGTGYTCGGFIHQTGSGIKYYPDFYNTYNLRWLYRMIDEPKLIKRYLVLYPKSVILFLTDFIKYKYFWLKSIT